MNQPATFPQAFSIAVAVAIAAVLAVALTVLPSHHGHAFVVKAGSSWAIPTVSLSGLLDQL